MEHGSQGVGGGPSIFFFFLLFCIELNYILFSGPLCSLLVERFGCRATVMLGGVLSGLGMAASSFSRSIAQVYVTAGVITGEQTLSPFITPTGTRQPW